MDQQPIQLTFLTERKNSDIEIIQVKDARTPIEATHYILIETQSHQIVRTGRHQKIIDASIKVRATYLSGEWGCESGTLICEMGGDASSSRVRLTNGLVTIHESMRGLHIGSYLFYKIVFWAKQLDPSTKIAPITLLSSDAYHPNKKRRNDFYSNSGIKFDWHDENQSAGISDPKLTVSDLTPHAHWPNITCDSRLHSLDEALKQRALLKDRVRKLRHLNRYYRREFENTHARLKQIATLLNKPLYIICFGLGAATSYLITFLIKI